MSTWDLMDDFPRLLDALECVVDAELDPFEQLEVNTDVLVLGRCTADGYAMARDTTTWFAWRPWNIGRDVPCPADRREYPTANGVAYMGLCQSETFEAWKPGRRA